MRAVIRVTVICVLAGAAIAGLAQTASNIEAKQVNVLDLAAELEGMQGKRLLMRTVTFPPGSRTPEHNHQGRPALVYVVQGTFTEHRNGVATEYGPGTGWIEDHTTTHWVENRGSTPAVQLSVALDSQPQ
jgi:quercetin dioxygenase-like cupin family protein